MFKLLVAALIVVVAGLSLTVSAGATTRYYRKQPQSDPKHYSNRCVNQHEISELQRRFPQTNWPKSMRCFPHR
jgi:hypothetical protein